MRNLFRVIVLTSVLFLTSNTEAVSNKGFRADMSFLDFEEVTDLFHPHHKQVVHKIKHANSPLEIIDAEVSDRGTVFFKGLSGAQNTYSVKVKNNSGREILAYEVTWVLKHPFEDYVFHKIHSNSIEPVGIGDTQELKFRRSKHYRDDAYYYAEISKVEFDDDESIWEAPDLEDTKLHTRLDEVKKEIDAMEEDINIDKLDDKALELLKQQYSNGAELLDEETEGKVELEEIKSEKIEELQEIKEVKKEVIETSSGTVTKTITTKTEETKLSETEAITDPQELMKAVDELIRSQKEENVILESDLVKAEPVVETVETQYEKVIEETSPVIETTIIDTKPITETKSSVKVIETVKTKVEETVETTVDELEDAYDDEDFEDEEDFEDDDFDIDFGDDDDFDDDF